MSIYGHVLPAQGQQAAARFAALVDGGEAQRIAAWEQAAGMLRLDGSDTVVAWGSRVRHQLMVAAHAYYLDAGMSDVEFAARLEGPARATTAASWWIDQRETAPADLEELLTDKADAAESDTENPY